MQTLLSAKDRQSIVDRIGRLTPADRRRWGKMQVGQMICHLTDSYHIALEKTDVSTATGPLRRSIVKWLALKSPTRWPKGVPTRPEIEQGAGGTPPTDFESDRARLLAIFERFCAATPTEECPHPIFGALTNEEWMRWGWLHADHHLRQFGR
ncbi:MAG TPA: DUF1569 domain-containing protein [Acidobacteriaceae bacterium]|nr:DUF1569 domain-containing protein [Acidobacteriaceae bacterium]